MSEREAEILDLMAKELSNEAIAARLGIQLKTVRNHISNICTKLHVADRTTAVLRARRSWIAAFLSGTVLDMLFKAWLDSPAASQLAR